LLIIGLPKTPLDRTLLGIELQYLTELEIDFDVTVTGLTSGNRIF